MLPVTTVEGRIHLVRGRKVILDRDLAELYGVSTKALNQAVKRNIQRFPDEFVFQVAKEEADSLRSQSVTLNEPDPNRSQIVTLNEAVPDSRRGKHLKYLPYAFTEHGALMAANVLRSPRAIQMSVVIVQTFVRLSRMAVSMDALARRVEELGRATSENSEQIKKIVAAIRELMTPPEPPRRQIGFHTRPEDKNPVAKHRKIREQ
ncbi:MAG: ORF6N domain-containing protein [Verrucomicrobiota bacterium]